MPCHLRDGIAVLLAFLPLQAAPSPPGSEIVGAPAAPFCRLGEGPPPNLRCDDIPLSRGPSRWVEPEPA
jgi:hypothetical protein